MPSQWLASAEPSDWVSRESQCCSASLSAGRIPSCSGEVILIFFRPSVDWDEVTLLMEGNPLYSVSTNLKVNFIPKHPYRNIQYNA